MFVVKLVKLAKLIKYWELRKCGIQLVCITEVTGANVAEEERTSLSGV